MPPPPKRRTRLNRTLLKIHKWSGIAAALWLTVLGVTGVLLDHDEWRWQRQVTVPREWISERVQRLLPASVMRFVAVDPDNPSRWFGASERGFWETRDRGASWSIVPFAGGDLPMVTDFVRPPDGNLAGLQVATDDGIWRVNAEATAVEPFALAGVHINAMSAGSRPGELVGIADHERIFRLSIDRPATVSWIDVDDVVVTGLPESVSLFDFVFDLHFGYGIFGRTASTLINDYGGIAFVVLSVTGLLYWWFPRRWRRGKGPSSQRRQRISAWLYRFHAPVIGLLALIPILYLSVTGIFLDHVYGFIGWGRDVPLSRSALPPVYQYESLTGELDDVIAWPGDPDAYSISTRLGILHSADGGRRWQADPELGAVSGNLIRERDHVVISNNAGTHLMRRIGTAEWTPIEGPRTMISDAVLVDDTLYLKNSAGFYAPGANGGYELTDITMPDLEGATFYMFMVDLHTGNTFHEQFKWVNDAVSVLAILLVLSGPILWWRQKWR